MCCLHLQGLAVCEICTAGRGITSQKTWVFKIILVGMWSSWLSYAFFYDDTISVDLRYGCHPCRSGKIEIPPSGVWSITAELKCLVPYNTGRLKNTLPLLCCQLYMFEGRLIYFVCMSLQECLLPVNIIFCSIGCYCTMKPRKLCKALWREWL